MNEPWSQFERACARERSREISIGISAEVYVQAVARIGGFPAWRSEARASQGARAQLNLRRRFAWGGAWHGGPLFTPLLILEMPYLIP